MLVKQVTPLGTGGNRVLSYLDLIAPETADVESRRFQLYDLAALIQERPLPVAVRLAELTVIFGATPRIASPGDEYRALLDRALRMLPTP